MADNKDCGALWNREKDGKTYMTGVITIEGVAHEIVVFQNGFKKDKQPDWRIYPSKPRVVDADSAENGDERKTMDDDGASSIPF